ncbi:MAG: DDE-type integrase/transposase/recombinase [Bacteroidota bacterium]
MWVGDITYLPNQAPSSDKCLYLAVWMDLYSRRIVGSHIEDHMEAYLVIEASQKVVQQRRFNAGLIVHSNGGGQYKAQAFRLMLDRHGCLQSMT